MVVPGPGVDSMNNSPDAWFSRSRMLKGPSPFLDSSSLILKPAPLSFTERLISPLFFCIATLTCVAPLCLAIFLNDS